MKMSSKLVTDRKERIALMSNWARNETEFKIKHFEELSEKQPEYKTMYGFDQVVWVDKPEFMALLACETGLRPRLLEEYFNLLKTAERLEENPRVRGIEIPKFRDSLTVTFYLTKHPELK